MDDNKKQFSVLCATDENYVPYCGIMITSLFENNRDLDLCVYIITDTHFSKAVQRKFMRLENQYHQHIEIVKVDKSLFENYPTKDMSYWTVAMYYRLLASEVLPASVDLVLYLDCDIVVTGHLTPLLDINMDNFAAGAVDDVFADDKGNNRRLEYPSSYSYFNSGVFLINLKYWRDNGIQKQCLDYLFLNYDKLSANDQDVLNAVLFDKTIYLPITFNYQVLFRKNDIFKNFSRQKQRLVMETEKPLIIHYAMQIKPWDIQYYKLPFAQIWQHYKRISLWWYCKPRMPERYKIKYFIKRYIFWPLGIMYNWPGSEFLV